MNEIIPDLLYPPDYKKKKRTDNISDEFLNNLELNYVAAAISPYHIEYTRNILGELQTDIKVIRYRQDILEDFLSVPQLESVLAENIRTIVNNARTLRGSAEITQSFFELSDNVSAISSYIECMEKFHTFYTEHGSELKSFGIIALMKQIEENYNTDEYKSIVREITLLKNDVDSGIRSVTIGINFDDMMRPEEAALLGISRERFREKGLFDKLIYGGTPNNTAISKVLRADYNNGGSTELNRRLFEEINKISTNFTKKLNRAMQSFYRNNITFIIDLLPQINYYSGALNMIDRFQHFGLKMCKPDIREMNERIFKTDALFDPAFVNRLFGMKTTKEERHVVKNACTLDSETGFFIITGPNNGGKTTYIRAIGIMQVLAQAGLYVPGSEAVISIVDNIFTHFPKEEEVGINTSRFTEECKQFGKTISTATEHSLVLMNESISSTTPTECVIIASEILKTLTYIGVRGAFATHLLDLTDKIEEINASGGKTNLVSMTAEYNDKGERTYRIIKGLPKKSSQAYEIFKKYGISFDRYKKQH